MLSKKTIKLTALALMLAMPFFAGAKEKKNYNVSAFQKVNTLSPNKAAGSATRKQVATLFPGWMTTTDKLSGTFTDIYGTPLSAEGNSLQEKSGAVITEKLSKLGVKENEWQKVNEYEAPRASYINYKHIIDGHTVVFASMNFRFTKAGELARIQMKNYGTPKKTTLSLSTNDAKNAAIKDIDGMVVSNAGIDAEWAWFPIPTAAGYTLHPAWHFKIKGTVKGSVPLLLTGYVDATNGDLLYRTNEVKETAFDVAIKGMVYRDGTLHPATLQALPDLWVNRGIDTLTTDTAGYCSSLLWTLPINAHVPLAGKWATVIDSITAAMPNFMDTITLPGTVYTYPTIAPSSDRHVNAYYHVNRIHNFMKGFFTTFTDMDFSLLTNVDVTSGNCNAFYDGASINFYQASAGCYSFAEIGDIIYHEYGHGITDHFYLTHSTATMENGALNEANSDIWAMSITRNPILGENCFTGYGGFIRRYDNAPQVYPLDLQISPFADPHQNGQIIAGAWWDVGVNIGSIDTMSRLFTDVYYDVPDGPDGTEGAVYQSILVDALMADDNNTNLLDGTPHYNEIIAAFARHGIYLEGEASLVHAEIANRLPATPIPVTASLAVDNDAYVHDVTLNYRLNSTGSWNAITMAVAGFDYSCTIPGQPEGTTVEYFFTLHDALGTPNAYFPLTCNPAIPAEHTTLPYQFGVGVVTIVRNDFETSTAGWGIGGNPGDDATAGLWQWGVPVAPVFSGGFPPQDYTTGTGKCLVTGVGSGSGWMGLQGISIANGTTTALTPVFDISSYANPIIEYYRWFSNEQGDNFKNDPWMVQIKNTAGGTWQNVEKTYQPDVQWRHRIFPVSAYLTGASHIQLRFIGSDSVLSNWYNNGQSSTIGGLDDFIIKDKGDNSAVNNLNTQRAEIHPNPADNTLSVTFSGNDNNGQMGLYDMSGRQITTTVIDAGNNNYSINTEAVAPGVYNLVIQTGKSIECRKVVVAH